MTALSSAPAVQDGESCSGTGIRPGVWVLLVVEAGALIIPVAAVCVTYHVGSRNEAAGHTGSTHILEHLLFKDTEKFKKADGKDMTLVLEYIGALLNATTWFDRTNYFECVPNDRLEQALDGNVGHLGDDLRDHLCGHF